MKIKKYFKVFSVLVLIISFFVLSSENTLAAKESGEVEEVIKEYFSNTSHLIEMTEIARCESGLRQFTDAGNVFRGAGTVGVFQIHEVAHLSTALVLGLNLETVEGNVAYAKYLYDLEGLSPWRFSGDCWEKTAELKKIEFGKALENTEKNSEFLVSETKVAENILTVAGSDEKRDRESDKILEKTGKTINLFKSLEIEETDSEVIAKLKLQVNLLIRVLELVQELNLLQNSLIETA